MMLRNARSIAYIDPASGRSSGISGRVVSRASACCCGPAKGGTHSGRYADECIARGKADIVLQQAREILRQRRCHAAERSTELYYVCGGTLITRRIEGGHEDAAGAADKRCDSAHRSRQSNDIGALSVEDATKASRNNKPTSQSLRVSARFTSRRHGRCAIYMSLRGECAGECAR